MFRLFDFNILTKMDMDAADNTDENDIDDDDFQTGDQPYQEDEFLIQMFGLNQIGETCSITVTDYKPFFYILVNDTWTLHMKNAFLNHIKTAIGKFHSNGIIDSKLLKRKKLYGFDNCKEHKFIWISFTNIKTFNKVKELWYFKDSHNNKLLRKHGYVYNHTNTYLYESNIPPLLRFFHITNISPSGWVEIKTSPMACSFTSCKYEYILSKKQIIPLPEKETLVPYKICSFDIEADSSHGDFPIPIKSYKKLANNIIEYFEHHPDTWNKDHCGSTLPKLIRAAFKYESDDIPEISQVYPTRFPTLYELNIQINSFLTNEVSNDFSVSNTNEMMTIENMFMKAQDIIDENENKTDFTRYSTDDDEGNMIDEDGDDEDLEVGSDDIGIDEIDYDTIIGGVGVGGGGEGIPPNEPETEPHQGGIKKEKKKPIYTITSVLCDKRYKRDTLIEKLNKHLCAHFNRLQGDRVTFIGSTFLTYGSSEPYLNHCIALDTCDPIPNSVIESYRTEKDVLLAWTDLIQRENPDIIVGYNIFGFDYEFMFRRAEVHGCVEKFLQLSRNKGEICGTPVKDMPGKYRIEKTTMKQFEINFIKITGRTQIDLYNYFRREENLVSYKLDYVSGQFIGDYIKNIVELPNGLTQLYTKNITGLQVGNYIHIEEIGHTTEYYASGHKFCIHSIDHELKMFTINEPNIRPDTTTKKIRWCLAKDDVTPQDIFRLTKGSAADRAIIAKYCIADCNLVHSLIKKADVLTGFIEMARICSIPINFLVMRGQGIKLTSYISKKCREKNTLMPVMDNGNPFDAYEGAIVLPPKCNLYLDIPVACVDYASLYPSSIISENLSHDTKVWTKTYDLENNLVSETGEKDASGNFIYDNIPTYKYVNISYDVYRYIRKKSKSVKFDKILVGHKICRFVQPNEIIGTGIMPSILEELLNARKNTRKLIKTESDDFMKNVLDKRQLGYKVTANSLYGQCGAKTSTFYEQDIAASTTATGRLLILYAQRIIEECYGNGSIVNTAKYGPVKTYAEYIYGDTDSVFFTFNLRNITDDTPITGYQALDMTIDIAQQAGHLASSYLKQPHDLEYEKTFMPFCLLSKKRYVGMLYETDPNAGKRKEMGIVLKRRDNAPIVKDVYGGIIDILMKEKNITMAIQYLKQYLQKLTDKSIPMDKLIITKALRGYYVNPRGIAHKVLADRIAAREPGNKPGSGDRIPYAYIVTPKTSMKLTQGDKIETPQFITTNNLKIDYSFYISNQIMKPVGQLFALVLAEVYKICNPRVKKNINIATMNEKDKIKLVEELLFTPYLTQTNNAKNNLQPITSFFKSKK